MIDVPNEFRPHIRVDYPPNNKLIFEEWFYQSIGETWIEEQVQNEIDNILGREYLPIFWTSYYVNNNYGNDKAAKQRLQEFLNGLDRSKKYFTILQYDDGILNDVSHLDLKVFGSGGGKFDYPLPLIGQPHPYSFTFERDIFCNFMGAMTHDIRKQLLPFAKRAGYLTSTSGMSIDKYCANLARSIFTLAPRGYGLTSFRLAEAVQFGSIPVYISDKEMIPHNKEFDYGVIIKPGQIPFIDQILRAITPEEIKYKQSLLPKVWDEYFSYEGCKRQILMHI